ncbi:MAG: hypothetical protein HQL01_15115 [Nitrospirae bacterium]|nr:hypothetical protein [Nitrospirota bacterium]
MNKNIVLSFLLLLTSIYPGVLNAGEPDNLIVGQSKNQRHAESQDAITGSYTFISGRVTGDAQVQRISGDKVKVAIYTVSTTGKMCDVGWPDGVIAELKGNTATYTSGEYTITLRFERNKLIVGPQSTSWFCGAGVWMDGIYKKESSRP